MKSPLDGYSPLVAVTSPSFSRHDILKAEMSRLFPGCRLNAAGNMLEGLELLEFIKDAEAIIIGLEKIDESLLRQCTNLKVVAKYGVGLDNIDLDACNVHGITVGWTGGINRLSVAEMTLGFMLALCRNLFVTSQQLKGGKWDKRGGYQLSGKTVGIIGAGNIGREVVRLLKPFDCNILVNDIVEITDYCTTNALIQTTKEEIFSSADFITIHTPLTAETRNMINRNSLSMMKPSANLINTARGGIVCQDDLAWALREATIAGAALDVFQEEPPTCQEFLNLPTLICTPHIGGNSAEAVLSMGMSAIGHLKEFFSL